MEMKSWYECKVKIEVMAEGGAMKEEPKVCLVDALNFTEAEARVIEEMTPYTSGKLDVTDIKRAKYAEMFTSDSENADKWYKVKCIFITLDEKTQTEKRTAVNMLVQAEDFHAAVANFDKGMRGSMMDYQIGLVQETSIFDVFPYVVSSSAPVVKPEYEA